MCHPWFLWLLQEQQKSGWKLDCSKICKTRRNALFLTLSLTGFFLSIKHHRTGYLKGRKNYIVNKVFLNAHYKQSVNRSSDHSWASSFPVQTNNDPLICFDLWPLDFPKLRVKGSWPCTDTAMEVSRQWMELQWFNLVKLSWSRAIQLFKHY